MSMQSVRQFDLTAPRPGWRRITRHPAIMEYQRLVLLVLGVNVAALYWGVQNNIWWDGNGFALDRISNLALVNFSLAILIRQQRVVNLLFWLATRIPTSWPLWIRWGAGKVFHFGGLHIGGNVAGSAWFLLLLAGLVWNHLLGLDGISPRTIGVTAVMLLLLALMIATAVSSFRARFHDLFERVHRFAGWTVLALFWAQTVSVIDDTGGTFIGSPAIWMLCLITISIALPWMTLKKVPVEIVKPSNHAVVLRFNYGDTPFPGSSNSISLSPLLEWHAFANIPAPGEDGYRLIVSRAGDWTGSLIDNPPSHVWVKGITTSGVARIEVLFKKVVYIATGSGIGPVMPHLLAKDVPIRLIWSTRSPRKTYGDALVNEILEASPDALIWDTDEKGKPNLSQLAMQAVQDFDAEAVICISNQKLTRRVVHDLESLGVPAYGAIWDS
ncbi:hypothetical protein [Hoeflea sp. TYP-13]|uniref:hypothetical protein n=1 Tax=Hoeflea sp. TYP-13 TaxID=3230023 RepID=UPI0034C66F5E